MPQVEQKEFRILQLLRLSTFQIGSAMGDILTASVWNRVMISELGLPAWPVGLLIALRYLMSPLSLWAGHRSDNWPLWGTYRTSYIWLGRSLMVLSFPLLGVSIGRLSIERGDFVGWFAAFLCFFLYGMGTLLSGSPFLALVRDSVPSRRQGLAIGIVETALIVLFPVVAVGFGRWMQSYDEALFWQMLLATMGIGGFFWFFAIFGVEEGRKGRHPDADERTEAPDFRHTFAGIWDDGRTRLFFLFLSLATLAAWMQDNVLEPFGGDVFDLDVGRTTRFTAYWGSATVVTLLGSFYVWRRRPPVRQAGIARAGLGIMVAGMSLLAAGSFGHLEALLTPALLVFGAGFGFYTFGGLSLMAVMSPDPHSGAYLGLWTVSILISKGLGTFMGGAFRDIFLLLGGLSETTAYGLVFLISALGLGAAALLLGQLDVLGFARDAGRIDDGVAREDWGLEPG